MGGTVLNTTVVLGVVRDGVMIGEVVDVVMIVVTGTEVVEVETGADDEAIEFDDVVVEGIGVSMVNVSVTRGLENVVISVVKVNPLVSVVEVVGVAEKLPGRITQQTANYETEIGLRTNCGADKSAGRLPMRAQRSNPSEGVRYITPRTRTYRTLARRTEECRRRADTRSSESNRTKSNPMHGTRCHFIAYGEEQPA